MSKKNAGGLWGLFGRGAADGDGLQDAYGFSFEALRGGERIELAAYKGKVILLVNTASRCGFTGQYAGLEQLHRDFAERGLVVIGVPCNDFGFQEPGSLQEIGEFCSINYGVSFAMTAKYHVRGKQAHPFYVWARRELGFVAAPKWNFHKYLIDREGKLVDFFSSPTKPDAARLLKALEQALAYVPKAGS